jgi:flagellar biosynthesis/type III secretory pathway chaperone
MTFEKELMEILKKELELLNVLKELSYEKTDIIINSEIEKLEVMNRKEEELVNKMALVEDKRLQLMDSWGININTSLSEIIKKIPEGKEELMEIGEELVKSLADVQGRNQVNGKLINDNLEWLDFNMNLILNTQTPTTYGKKNNGAKANNSIFDRKV